MSETKNNKKESLPKGEKEPLGDRVEDKLDDFFGGIQDFLYGYGDNFNEDIPATMEMPSGIRKINKVQTRRNILKRIFRKKK